MSALYTNALTGTDVLLLRAQDHVLHPFPSKKVKRELSLQAGMTLVQVDDWFKNYRRRNWLQLSYVPPQSSEILQAWVQLNLSHPFPTAFTKMHLAASSNMSIRQVNDWFKNYRKRHWDNVMWALVL